MDVYNKPIYSDISLPYVDELSDQIIDFSTSNSSYEVEQFDDTDYNQLFDMTM